MNYQEAARIRKKSFMTTLTEKLVEGRGVGSAFKSTISERSAARAKGFREKIDPMNIIKFMTGGSKLAAAMYGSMAGRTKQDMQYFTGTKAKPIGDTATKIGQLESDNEAAQLLLKIYEFMRTTAEDDRLRKEKENNRREELEYERALRHKALIEALTGMAKPGTTVTATKEPSGSGFGGIFAGLIGFVKGLIDDAIKGVMNVIDGITDFISLFTKAFGGGVATFARIIFGLGKFLLFNPIGMAIVAGTGLVYALWKMLKSEPSEEAKAEREGIAQSDRVGGLPGVKDEMEKRKKSPEYERTMADIKDYEQTYNEGEKLNDAQLKGFANRGTESMRAVEDYKSFGTTLKFTPTSQAEAQDLENGASQRAVPVPVTPQSNTLNEKTKEMNDANLPAPALAPKSEVVNTTNIMADKKIMPVGPLPAVRNTEPTFANMILYSTRVV